MAQSDDLHERLSQPCASVHPIRTVDASPNAEEEPTDKHNNLGGLQDIMWRGKVSVTASHTVWSIYVNFLEGQNHRDEEQIRGCRGLGTVGRVWRREMAVGED